MSKIIVGINEKKENIFLEESNNGHIFVCGSSGTGKSTFVNSCIVQEIKSNRYQIIINWRRSATKNNYPEAVEAAYQKYAKFIDAQDGIPLPLFKKYDGDDKDNEKAEGYIIDRVTSLLTKSANLTKTQEACVYDAVNTVLHQGLYEQEGIQAISKFLLVQNYKAAHGAATNLRPICSSNVFVDGDFFDTEHNLYIIDLNSLEYDHQIVIVRFLMDYFLRMANRGAYLERGINIFLDEAENMDYREGSVMYTLLNESRKLNVHLMLAAPSIYSGRKNNMDIVTQCGTCVYFRPVDSERRKIAKLIDPIDEDRYVYLLSSLPKYGFIAKGTFSKQNNKVIHKTRKLQMYIPCME